MNAYETLGHVSPAITKMIRFDHTHTLTTAHGYETGISPRRKRAIAHTVCAALEVHAQLEEEIFYPALREAGVSDEVLDKAKPEHDGMRRWIGELRAMEPTDLRYDESFHALMREVTHHVADEEAVLLPAAERLLAPRLGELGARMTKRRIELLGPRVGEVAMNHALATPGLMLVLAGTLLTGAWIAMRAMDTREEY
jgi:anaerobic glycerol-3-phosphate dehydrogenase